MIAWYFCFMDGKAESLSTGLRLVTLYLNTHFGVSFNTQHDESNTQPLSFHTSSKISLPDYALSSKPPLNRDCRVEDVALLLNKLTIGLGFGNGYIIPSSRRRHRKQSWTFCSA